MALFYRHDLLAFREHVKAWDNILLNHKGKNGKPAPMISLTRAEWRSQLLDLAVSEQGLGFPTNPLPSARGADTIQPTKPKHQTNHRHNHKQPVPHATSAPHVTMQSPYPLGLHDPQQCLLPTQPHEAIVGDSYNSGEQPSLLGITTPFSRDLSVQQFVITSLFGKEELSKPFCYIATTYSRNTQGKR